MKKSEYKSATIRLPLPSYDYLKISAKLSKRSMGAHAALLVQIAWILQTNYNGTYTEIINELTSTQKISPSNI
jgi:hypothetical protein